jgi:hypothetical protein
MTQMEVQEILTADRKTVKMAMKKYAWVESDEAKMITPEETSNASIVIRLISLTPLFTLI